jgi:hypothetical protein
VLVTSNHINTLIVEDATGAKSIQVQLWDRVRQTLRDESPERGGCAQRQMAFDGIR